MTTVTIGDLARITRRPIATIRNMQNRDGTPWRDDDGQATGRGRVRHYGVDHALALVICESIEAQGFTVSDATDHTKGQGNVLSLFLDELEHDKNPEPRFVMALRMRIQDSWNGAGWEPLFLLSYGTQAEVTDTILGEFGRIGREFPTRDGRSSKRYIGGPHIAVASVGECYRLLQVRAREAGFEIEGRTITERSQ